MKRGMLLSVIVIASIASSGCGDKPPDPQAAAPSRVATLSVTAKSIKPATYQEYYTRVGRTRAKGETYVCGEVSGKIVEIAAENGDTVTKGAKLAAIDESRIRIVKQKREAEVARAVASRNKEELELNRLKQLHESGKGGVSISELDSAKANKALADAGVAAATAELATTEKELHDCVVVSPIDGIVAGRMIDVGNFVSPGTKLFHIINKKELELEIGLIDAQVAHVAVGAKVPVAFDALPGTPFEGIVTHIGPQPTLSNDSYPVIVGLSNPDNRLTAGMIATVRIPGRAFKNVVTLPREIVRRDRESPKPFIFTLSGKGFVNRCSINILMEIGDSVLAEDPDLDDDESVILLSNIEPYQGAQAVLQDKPKPQ